MILSSYSGFPFCFKNPTTLSISESDKNAPCSLTGLESSDVMNNISPLPSNFSAPLVSNIVLESIKETTEKAILAGTLALIRPVMTLTEGR